MRSFHSLLLILFLTSPLPAAVRLAVVTTESGPKVDQVLLLVEGELGNVPEVELLDRKSLTGVLAEQKLALSGLIDPAQAVKAGKVLNADLFAVIEVSPEDHRKTLGLTAVDCRSGVRLWDQALPGDDLEAIARDVAAGVRGALAKSQAQPTDRRTVGLLTVRNADLPASQDVTVQAVARLLERQLIQSPHVAVVERSRLRSLIQERNLPTREVLPPLLASMSLIEVEISRDKDAMQAVARITDAEGKETGTVQFTAAEPLPLVTGLSSKVLESLRIKLPDAPLNAVLEADRFSNESWVRWRHGEWEQAAREAEAAYALDPSQRRLRWLIDRLAESAIELVDPGQQTQGGLKAKTIDPVKLEQSLAIMHHGLDLFGLLFQRAMHNPEWYRDRNGLGAMWYRNYLSKITVFNETTSPRSKAQVAEWVRRFRHLEFDVHGKGLETLARHGKAFGEYSSWVSGEALLDLFGHYPSTQPDWSQAARDTIIAWADVADAAKLLHDKQRLRSSDYVLTTIRWNARRPKKTDEDYAHLQAAYDHLQRCQAPLLRLHGQSLAAYQAHELGKLSPEEARAKATTLLKDLEPFVVQPDGPAQDFQTRRCWIDLALRTNELLSADDRAAANRTLFDLLESRDVYSAFVTEQIVLGDKVAGRTKDQHDFLTRAIALLEKTSTGINPVERPRELLRLKEWKRTAAEALGIKTEVVTPWASVRTLLDVQKADTGVRSLVRPVVAGRVAYALGMDWNLGAAEVAFRLLQINVDTGDVQTLSSHVFNKLPRGMFGDGQRLENGDVNQLTVLERSTMEGSYFIRSACLHDDAYYAATLGRGIVKFPLNGGSPTVLGEKQGLPSDAAQYLLSHDGWLYAWMGLPGKSNALCRMKGDGSQIEVLSSSRRTIRQTPLDSVSPVWCDFLIVDPDRRRLLFRLTNSNSDSVMGLWEMSLDTKAFKQLKQMHLVLRGHAPRLLPGEKVLIKQDFQANLFDLKSNELRPLVRATAEYPGNFHPLWLFGDELWQTWPFSSVNVKTGRVTLFPSLRATERVFQPGVFEPVSETEFLVGDPAGLWLMTLKGERGQ